MNNDVRELSLDELDQAVGALKMGPLSIDLTENGNVVIWLKGVGGIMVGNGTSA
jgi:hypothetical protein